MGAQKPTIVLVPGAWHYPQCYDLLVDRLHKHDYETRAVKLKSVIAAEEPRVESRQEDVDAVREVIQPLIEQGKEIIVLGHSYGGTVISEAASGLGKKNNDTGGIVHLIYCCAFLINEGDSIMAMRQNSDLSPGIPQHYNTLGDDGLTLRILKEHAIDALYNDVEPELAQKAVDSLGLHCLSTILTPQEKCAYKEISTTYILCEQDKTIFPFLQQYMVDQAGIKDVVKLNASHSPFLSQPDNVFDIVDRVARTKRNEEI